MSSTILSSAYFAPVQWYQKLNRYDEILIEAYDSFIKQAYRNRCLIATTNGVQALTVPVERMTDAIPADGTVAPGKCLMKDVRISDHGICIGTRCKVPTASRRSSSSMPMTYALSSSAGGHSFMISTWRYVPKCASCWT